MIQSSDGEAPVGPLAVLQRIRQAPARTPEAERCEMCAEPIAADHRHVVDLENRSLLCACTPCSLLFTRDGAGGGRFRAVPDRYLVIEGFRLSAGQWDGLQIPVTVAFFFRNSTLGQMAAFYPSPAGATESLLPLDAWSEIESANPVVRTLEADVEAVLIRRDRDTTECFIVPIDACYELVGHLRRLWRGFDGGSEAHHQMTAFFNAVRARARIVAGGGGG
ncbi:MAG TPA: DUF5947 family protein [Acidimicrobiales bacterium]|nr:DUF5947 family protein [Acidimicrobiales bacterium]